MCEKIGFYIRSNEFPDQHSKDQARKTGYNRNENRFLQNHCDDRKRRRAQGFPDADFFGALFYDDQHNISHAHHAGNDGANTHKPEKRLNTACDNIDIFGLFQRIVDIQRTLIVGCYGMTRF